jgi:hypothetical protein
VAISDATVGEYNILVKNCGLLFLPATFPESYGGTEVPAFHWSDETEPQQEARYLSHLTKIIPLKERHLQWKPVKNKTSLFQAKVPGFKLTGTTDVAVIDTRFRVEALTRAAIALIVELKRKYDDDAFRQGVLELVAHASMGETAWPPLALVTDLNDTWCFLWLNDGRKISVLSGTRAQAVKFICDLFNSDNHVLPDVPEFQQLNTRGGLQLGAQIYCGTGPADVGNLEDVKDAMTEEEFRLQRAQEKFNMYLQANPFLCSMYS